MQRSVQQTNGDGVLASSRKKQRLSNASAKVTVVLGAQWGDEGKGKVVDMLAMDADVVCRCQVSPPSFSLPPTFFLLNANSSIHSCIEITIYVSIPHLKGPVHFFSYC